MRRTIHTTLTSFLLLFISFTSAQKEKVDSLKALLGTAKHDTVRCFLLTAMIEFEFDEKAWPVYNDSLYQITKRNLNSRSSKRTTNVYLEYYANAINNRGFLAQEYGNITKALEYYFEALDIQDRLGNTTQVGVTLSNIAYIYMNQDEFDKSLEFVNKALEIQKKIGNTKGIASAYNNIGNLYIRKNDRKRALEYFELSLDLSKKIDDSYGVSTSLANIANINEKNGDYEKAVERLKEALKIREQLKDKEGISYNLYCLARIMLHLNRTTEALNYAEKSFKIAREIHYAENLRNSSAILFRIYKSTNNPAKALEMHELYVTMRDSIRNESIRQSTIKKDLQYSYDKKAAADSVMVAEERKVVAAQLEEEKTKRFALYGGLALVIVFAIFMANRFVVTNKQKKIIENKEREALLQNIIIHEQKQIVEEKQKEILDSIHYAKRIQTALIANAKFINENLPENFVYFNPKDIVSGDFYWATSYNDKFYLAICDSTGHGVPGAFMSLLNMGFLSEAIKEKNIDKPNEIFDYVRERLINSISTEGQKDGMDGILLCYDKKKKTYEYAAANNEPILIRNGAIMELEKDKMPVGKGERSDKFTLHQLDLQKGDVLYLYTDGFADQFGGPKGKKFKYKQLNELLQTLTALPPQQQRSALETAFQNWKGNLEQVDDVLIAGIKV